MDDDLTVRQLYATATEVIHNEPGAWNSLRVTVHRTDRHPLGEGVVGDYVRNYPSLLYTFEPFVQDGHHYALISQVYAFSSVMDLESGQVIAEEEPQPGAEFCPAEFYVPDPNDPTIWDYFDDHEVGLWGLVSGCRWGDDDSWKVRYLDLSKITEGTITNDDRFGYVELPHSVRLRGNTTVYHDGTISLPLAVSFDLTTGQRHDD